MNEDAMDDTIRELARRAYNPPLEAPRDELWQRIRAELDARRARAAGAGAPVAGAPADEPPIVGRAGAEGPAAGAVPAPSLDGRAPAAGAPGVIDLTARRRRIARWTVRAAPIAALLMLSFYLGRWSHFWDRTTPRPVAASGGAGAPAMQTSPSTPASSPATGPTTPAPAPLAAVPGSSGEGAGVAAPGPRLLAYRSGGTPAGRAGARMALYRLAAQQTLGQAEMLLTSFRAEARTGAVDPQVTTWAGDVLSSTRLLLDSPAARDPRLRGLLEDLELVLTQIVQLRTLPSDSSSAETDFIDHALQQRDLMLRLRSAVPAGVTVGT